MRELIFHKDDTLPVPVLNNAVERSRENLLNTSLFNFVNIEEHLVDSSHVTLLVKLAERWYIWPVPIFELVDRNFNEWWLTKDFNRINYGIYLSDQNFRGRKENLRLILRLGYSQRLGISYSIPYINRMQKNGLSFSVNFSRNHEIAYNIDDSKLVYYKNTDDQVRKEYSSNITFTHREGIYKSWSVGTEYNNFWVDTVIASLNNDYYNSGDNRLQALSLGYSYRDDHRDNRDYPLKGYIFDFNISKVGFKILEHEPDLMFASSSLRNYFDIGQGFNFSTFVKGRITSHGKIPYYFNQALGYGTNTLRGYEYYVINGQNYFLAKANLKYTLLRPRIIKLKFIPTEKFNTIPYAFYLNIFADAGYAQENYYREVNPLANEWQYSYGAGIDYVTYYSLVMRLDFSINKFGEHGFFLHFTAPI